MRLYERGANKVYVQHCRRKAAEAIAAETEESLQAQASFQLRTFSRAELHVYNIRHIQHHAAEQGVYGHWMLEELRRHGYRLSPGTLYPVLARMARLGWLKASRTRNARDARVYRITRAGADVLERLRGALEELQREVGRSRR